ncbi:hypothetical protein NDA17_000543 [Ustilago hordei]|nr:hypothetical protein NDA17_000543 [Ustilago hordei]
MRNPLHSGLGSLLFLSLVPVAISLPAGPNWSPYGFQSHDFQNQNLDQWPPSSLQSVVTQQGPNVPQHQLPQQHLSSFWNAPQLAHVPQHQLPQQHLGLFGDASQLAHVSAVPAMHSRASKKRASRSGKKPRPRRFHYAENTDIFDLINKEKFQGQLVQVDFSNLDTNTRDSLLKVVRQPHRLQHSISLEPQGLENDAGTISEVEMSIHKGSKVWAKKNEEVFASINPDGQTFYNFWGIPKPPKPGAPKITFHYGMGYIRPDDFQAPNRQIDTKVLQGAEAAAHLH